MLSAPSLSTKLEQPHMDGQSEYRHHTKLTSGDFGLLNSAGLGTDTVAANYLDNYTASF